MTTVFQAEVRTSFAEYNKLRRRIIHAYINFNVLRGIPTHGAVRRIPTPELVSPVKPLRHSWSLKNAACPFEVMARREMGKWVCKM